jgi:23S rRNA U2552 (ribose-2'-O)-methylase RlmE/FtsJ
MIFFLLPKTHIYIYKNLEYSDQTENPIPVISNSLSHYLSDIKEKITTHERDWDIFKKYTNPYEYIHTLIPNKKKCVAKDKPLSRSYFKMIELANIFKLKEFTIENTARTNLNEPRTILRAKQSPIKTFHLAEGPGGFIEAIVNMRNNPDDVYTGMTILDDKDDFNVPAWKKSQLFLKENPNVFIENGADGTGNILNVENFMYCKEKYASTMDLITADGGFDFSIDFNSQEISIGKLLYAQIAYALTLQKKDGSFVIKIFDSFMAHTIDLLFLLSSFYEKVYITKPQTSRYANSEKYIVCKKFIFRSCEDFYPYLLKTFENMVKSENKIHRFLSLNIPTHFLSKLEEYNSIFGQHQIENIYYTISLIETKNKSDKIDLLVKTNIQKSISWCMKHNIQYNNIINNANIFLRNTASFNSFI